MQEGGISNPIHKPEISCIVLAGGKSERLGRDKALEPFGVGSLLEIVLSRLSLFNSEIILVTDIGNNRYERFLSIPRLRIAVDIYKDRGPLGGIYSGLMASMTSLNLIVACDMPFLNMDLINYMIALGTNYEVVVPRKGRYIEPLHAIYSRNCLKSIRNLLELGDLQVHKLFPMVRVRYVSDDEIVLFDADYLSFFNINNEEDLNKAKSLIKNRWC